jgi:DNA-binding transcriptional LysR family regulator
MDNQLEIFLAVARHHSFSNAAKSLHMTQPAVSMNIQALESLYGTKLFERNNKEVTLTESGRVLRHYAEQIATLYGQSQQALMKMKETITGPLSIGASLTIGEYVIPKALVLFKRMYPNINIALSVANTYDISQRMLNKTIDVGLIEGPVDNPDLQLKPFMEDQLVAIISPNNKQISDDIISLDQLKSMPLILREPGSGTRRIMEIQLKAAGLELQQFNIAMELGSTQAIKEIVEAGLGCSIISQCTVIKEIEAGILKAATIKGLDMRRYFYTLLPVHVALTPASAVFVEFVHNIKWKQLLIDMPLKQ